MILRDSLPAPRQAGHRRSASSASTKLHATHPPTNSPYSTSTRYLAYEYEETLSTGYGANKTAARIITSVRRSLLGSSTPKSRSPESKRTGMISTSAENTPPRNPRYRDNNPSTSPPTIEQIAMGLHISRTPHFRPLTSPYSQRNPPTGSFSGYGHPYDKSHRPPVLPPPPSRSSLKRSSTIPSTEPPLQGRSPASASSTTVTSNASPSSHSSSSSSYKKFRFFPKLRNTSSPSSISSASSSPRGSADLLPPKKAVRFSSQPGDPEADA